MKRFAFNLFPTGIVNIEDNGYEFKSKKERLGIYSLTTPYQKEVTYSKGPVARYVRHTVFGIGYGNAQFRGIAFFDLHIRGPIVSIMLLGISYASNSFISGFLWTMLFYALITFLSLTDDEALLNKVKVYIEKSRH